MILFDTHVLVWSDHEPHRLGRRTRAAIDRASGQAECVFSAVSAWEVGLLVSSGRLRMGRSISSWRDSLLERGFRELPVDGIVAIRATELIDLHRDPVDRLILATALVHGASLVTADRRLLGWMGRGDLIDAQQ